MESDKEIIIRASKLLDYIYYNKPDYYLPYQVYIQFGFLNKRAKEIEGGRQ